jgi:Transglutaminase-like superfamily
VRRTLADLTLFARMVAWSPLLPVLKFMLPLQSLTRLMWNGHSRPRDRQREETIVGLSGRLTRHRPLPGRDNCLERSLLAYRFLSAAGAEPKFIVGIKRTQKNVEGHVWVLLDGRPIHDDDAALADFVPLAEFGAGGTPAASGSLTGRAAQLKL